MCQQEVWLSLYICLISFFHKSPPLTRTYLYHRHQPHAAGSRSVCDMCGVCGKYVRDIHISKEKTIVRSVARLGPAGFLCICEEVTGHWLDRVVCAERIHIKCPKPAYHLSSVLASNVIGPIDQFSLLVLLRSRIMKVFLALCLVACVALTSVQSASVGFRFRNGREVLVPIDEAIRTDEIISELRKEADEVIIDEVAPVVLEEIVIPVETLRNVEPVIAVQEPVAFETAAVADQEVFVPESALRNAAEELVAVPEAAFVQAPVEAAVVEVIPEVRAASASVAEKLSAEEAVPAVVAEAEVPVVAEEVIVAKSADQVNEIVAEKVAEAIEAVAAEEAVAVKVLAPEAEAAHQTVETVPSVAEPVVAVVDGEIRQAAADGTTTRPNLLQAAQHTISNLIANNPIANAIQAIRQPPSADTPVVAPVDAAVQADAPSAPIVEAAETTIAPAAAPAAPGRPTLIQQFQNNVNNIQHQIQSALQNAQNSAAGGTSGENRPGFIQQIQNVLTRPIQSLFRPNANNDNKETETPAHDAVAADEVVAPVAAAAETSAEPITVAVVKEGIEIVADKIDDAPADAAVAA